MKKIYATLGCAALVAAFLLASPRHGYTDDTVPKAGKTGAPLEGTCANSTCHEDSDSGNGDVFMTFSGGNAYSPGTTYDITVKVSDPEATRFGFELTALNGANQKAGDLVMLDPLRQAFPTDGAVPGRQYISHKNADGDSTWTFSWIAPATSVGDVTFYYAGNGANNNDEQDGDHIYLNSTTISVNTAVALTGNNEAMFHAFNNGSEIHVNYSLSQHSFVSVELFDAAGKKVMNLERTHADAGNHKLTKPLHGLAKGTYIVRFSANGLVQTSKVIVL
ncbi:MAG TPA: choice-of-anchor V domain-containing protein [Chitinophagales bacterium]|nr:choice-of-anchor V domain-containing protein [Chitinophagales bacterium]